jgi:hypothetical protein
MLMKKLAFAALIAGLTVAGAAVATDKADAEAAIAAAKAAQKAASEADGEWRDTAQMIKDAEKAMTEGNYGNAVELAKKAEDQGNLGKEQALGQKNVGNPQYLYN